MALTRAGRVKRALLHWAVDRSVSTADQSWNRLAESQPGRGRSCVVVGNAPSASADDVPFESDFDVFAVNSGLRQPLKGLKSSYWVATDRGVFRPDGMSFLLDAFQMGVVPLLPRTALAENGLDFFLAGRRAAAFPGQRREPLEDGETTILELAGREVIPVLKTVTATAACLAAVLGYRRIALIGCDAYGQLISGADLTLHHYAGTPAAMSRHDAMRLSLSHRASYLYAARYVEVLGAKLVNYSRTTAVSEIPRGTGMWR